MITPGTPWLSFALPAKSVRQEMKGWSLKERIFTRNFCFAFLALFFCSMVMYMLMSTLTQAVSDSGAGAALGGLVTGMYVSALLRLCGGDVLLPALRRGNRAETRVFRFLSDICGHPAALKAPGGQAPGQARGQHSLLHRYSLAGAGSAVTCAEARYAHNRLFRFWLCAGLRYAQLRLQRHSVPHCADGPRLLRSGHVLGVLRRRHGHWSRRPGCDSRRRQGWLRDKAK